MRSMTAFGRAVVTAESKEISVELRSVNNRYLDWSIRLPRSYVSLEERIKTTLAAVGITRGKVDVTVTLTDAGIGDKSAAILEPDLDAARRYVEAARKLEQEVGVVNDLTAARLLTLPGVMVPVKEEAADDDTVWAWILPVLTEAATQFMAAREREGARLSEDLLGKLAGVRDMTATLAAATKTNIASYRSRFEERLKNVMDDHGLILDESRVITECAIYADRVAIDEELVRLASHFDALEELFRSVEPVGRRIDFMLQETNREVNTIGSKCSDADMAHTVAEIKSELEKIREQIQNIE
ncbi:MAG: YicC family protein [Ruminococcaceae bacterium]|nr:YicC family protein [Oscillospiraceae bacterium]